MILPISFISSVVLVINTIFVLQIVVSFVAGGCFITLLSLLAERANENVAGIIMMFPSTIVLGFFFLGLTTSPEKVSLIIPATLIPLGIVIFSSVIYIYCSILFSKYFKSKIPQILITFGASSLIWFILAAPFAIWKFSNLTVGITGFFILIMITHLILNRIKYTKSLPRPLYTKNQMILRAFFTGIIIALVVFLGKVLNPFWGGIFTMFPAATFAALIIFHFYYEPRQLFYFFKKAPIGSLSLFIYAIVVMILFPKFGILFGSIISYSFSLTFSILIIKYKFKAIHN